MTLNEVKEQMVVVRSVGEFTNALQQIATLQMMKLRTKVVASRPFVEAASSMLLELSTLKNNLQAADLLALERKSKYKAKEAVGDKKAIIVITSNAGLTGRYNQEIFTKMEKVVAANEGADFYVIGKKGQEYFGGRRFHLNRFPYQVPDNFTLDDIERLIKLFDYYPDITLVYSRYINSATRDVVSVSVVKPELEMPPETASNWKPPKYIFEPSIFELIDNISTKLRGALFQQQLFDARLSQFAAQMVGMKTASDNSVGLLADMQMEYNKQRRKMIDKKIGEVFAGSALW